jgi:hypothetical protein
LRHQDRSEVAGDLVGGLAVLRAGEHERDQQGRFGFTGSPAPAGVFTKDVLEPAMFSDQDPEGPLNNRGRMSSMATCADAAEIGRANINAGGKATIAQAISWRRM